MYAMLCYAQNIDQPKYTEKATKKSNHQQQQRAINVMIMKRK